MENDKIEETLIDEVKVAELKTYRVRDILPNPYRHLERYKPSAEKVQRLIESYDTTGFWSNIVVRKLRDGTCEQAYGHHRQIALRQKYGGDHEVSVLVADIDDAMMLKVMANENMKEWGASPYVMMETVRSIVQAYGAGEIKLGECDKRTNESLLRYAPSFVQGASSRSEREHPYVATQISDFIGLSREDSGNAPKRIVEALAALELIEVGSLDEADVNMGLTDGQFADVVRKARAVWQEASDATAAARKAEEKAAKTKGAAAKAAAQKEAAEKKAAAAQARKEAAAKARAGSSARAKTYKSGGTKRDADKAAEKAQARSRRDKVKSAEDFSREVVNQLQKMLREDMLKDKLDNLLSPDIVEFVSDSIKNNIAAYLTGLGDRAHAYARRFEAAKSQPKLVTPKPKYQLETREGQVE